MNYYMNNFLILNNCIIKNHKSLVLFIFFILIIRFDENENNTIFYHSEENKNIYTRGFRLSKSGKIGAGGIFAIIFACAAIIAALILTYLCCKKDKAGEIENKESTILNLKN